MTDFSYQSALKAAQDALDALALPVDLDFERLLEIVKETRGRALIIRPADALAGSLHCGQSWSTRKADLVLYGPSRMHYKERFSICHELGHLILGHLDNEVRVLRPVPDLAPWMVAQQLGMGISGSPAVSAAVGLTVLEDSPHPLPPEQGKSKFTNEQEGQADATADLLVNLLRNASVRRLSEPLGFGQVFG